MSDIKGELTSFSRSSIWWGGAGCHLPKNPTRAVGPSGLESLHEICSIDSYENNYNCCHQMSDIKANIMHQILFRLGLCPRLRWGAYSAPQILYLVGRGWLCPSPRTQPRSRPFRPRRFCSCLEVFPQILAPALWRCKSMLTSYAKSMTSSYWLAVTK